MSLNRLNTSSKDTPSRIGSIAVADMDKWGGTISITLAGLFWVKDNDGSNASPASVRQIPANDMVYAKKKLNDRILFVPGGKDADLTGTLGSVTESLAVEIAGKAYAGVDNMNGTWKLPGSMIAGLPVGTYDVKVTAKNSIGLVRTDATTNKLTIAAPVRARP